MRAGADVRALGRSLDIYYRDVARVQRMDALNVQFVPRDGLAFDIGAHVGDRAWSFLRHGARVVALEPQPRLFRALRLMHGRKPGLILRREAVGAAAGRLNLHVNSANPTISSGSRAFVAAASQAQGWEGQVWDSQIEVPVTTLDQLIGDHGRPDFIKIDVEGLEAQALQGLSVPVPALSFEFTTIQREVAYICLERLASLGNYTFNVSLGEEHVLRFNTWLSPADMRAYIAELRQDANSGDVYARLAGHGTGNAQNVT